jgi:hypothetical protein
MAISAIAGLAAAGGAFAAATIAGTAFGLVAFATTFAIGAGLSIVSRALMPKPDLGGLMQGVTGTVREATASRKVIYGKVRVGGAVVFIANSNQNKDLYLVICFACHEIEGYEAVYLNDEKVWENGSYVSDWASYANFAFYDGTQTTADSVLSGASAFWGSTHVLNGIAYMRVKLTWDEDRKKFPQGVPNVSAVIKGKKLYDPRLDSTIGGSGSHRSGDPSTWEWSQNPALALYDYMTNTYYGLGEDHLSMDYDAFGDAADVCDEAVTLDAGGTHDRYHADGVLDTGNAIKGNIEALTAAMGGRVGYVDGKYFAQASKYYTPTITIDESMMVGAMSVQTKQSRRSMYNGVKGVFLSEEENYTLVDYPAKISSTYSTQDGDPIYLDMPLPFVTNNIRAQRLAKIALLKSRQQVVVNVPLNLAALKFKAGDFIAITSDRMDWSAKPFEVIGYDLQIGNDGAIIVNVQAIETDSDVYDWTASADEDPFNEPSDPTVNDGTTVAAPTNLQLEETTSLAADGTVLPALKISWTASVDGFVEFYEVEVIELSGGVEQSDTTIFNTTTLTEIFIVGLRTPSVEYRVKVRAVNLIGVKSADLSNSTALVLQGDTTAPSAPTSVTATGTYKAIIVTWTNPTASDLKEIEIYRSDTSNGTYSKIAVVTGESYTDQVLTFGTTKYYKTKAVDFSGNKSGFSNSDSGTTTFIDTDEFTQGVEDLFANANVNQVEIVSSLPASGDYTGQVVFLTTDNQLYRWTGSAWTAAVPSTEVTGQLTDAQLAAIAAAKITGQITTTQITDDAITTPKINAGAVSSAEIAAGAVVADKIASNAITTAKIEAGAVTANEIASATITGNKIVANTITGGLLSTAGIITSSAQIDDALITNAKIDNGAITAAKIGSLAVETAKIANNAVTIPDGQTFSATNTTITTSWADAHTITVDFGSGWADVGSVLVFASITCQGVLGTNNNPQAVFARVSISGGTSPRGQVQFTTDRPGRIVAFSPIGELPGPSQQTVTYAVQVLANYSNTTGGYWKVGNGTLAVMGSKK